MSNNNNNNKDLNNFNDLKINDQDTDDENDGDNDNGVKLTSNGRLEKLLSNENSELLERAKTKKPTEPVKPQLKTIKPRPDGKEFIVIPNSQILSVNGSQYFFNPTANSLIQLNRNTINVLPQQQQQLQQQQQYQQQPVQIQINQQQQNTQIEKIKSQLQQTVTSQISFPIQNFDPSFISYNNPVNSPSYNAPSVSGASDSLLEDLFDTYITPDVIPNIHWDQQPPQQQQQQQQSSLITNFEPYGSMPLDERDICTAEISLLPNLESVIKLKKDRGET